MLIRTIPPAPSPEHHHLLWSPSPSPSTTTTTPIIPGNHQPPQNSRFSIDLSPPVIAMVVVIGAAFLVITYSRLISRYLLCIFRRYRRWRHRRRRLRYLASSTSDGVLDSPPPLIDSPEGFHIYSPYGLEESVIKTIPLSVYTTKSINFLKNTKDCAVCLLEFEENDYVRTLPVCSHSFHVDCIDIWLRSHANCPLCRASIFRPESPFIPVMAARIRPSLDDTVFHSLISLEIPANIQSQIQSPSLAATTTTTTTTTVTEITPCIEEQPSPRRHSSTFNLPCSNSEDMRFNGNRSLLLKRSYSFGFERSLASERMLVTEPATTSPWRYRRGSFWSKRPSPFGYTMTKPRVFSFRGMKSPAFFRRRGGFFPLSERFGSSRRTKSMTSPMFMRSSVSVAAFSSSRLRCGDPEALLSPERFNRR